MYVRFHCPVCGRTCRVTLEDSVSHLECPHCEHRRTVPAGVFADGSIHRCIVCPSMELFFRKNFPQRLGAMIVVVGLAASCVTWYHHSLYGTYGILFATALMDLMLYLLMGNVVTCYRCRADYGGFASTRHKSFDLEVHERHRQEAARLNQ